MVRHAALILALALASSGCFDDRYRCTNDQECDLGEGGRCELDGHCTQFDASCATQRVYTPHSEELTATCFDDRRPLANLCAGGQPPALAEGDACATSVCLAMPACCDVGWTDACAQAAQLASACSPCALTSITVTATKGVRTELWQLDWNGTDWDPKPITGLEKLVAWVGPRLGEAEPRLAGFADGATTLVIGTERYPVDPTHDYQSITTIDVDRDGRDTAALTYQVGAGPVTQFLQVLKLDTSSSRDVDVGVSQFLTWGDTNHDGFPDAVAGTGTKYTLLDNADADGAAHVRSLAGRASSNLNGMATPGTPPMRTLDWLDFNSDRELDLVVSGNSFRVHDGAANVTDAFLFNLDCDPPAGGGSCDQTEFSHTAIAFPTSGGPALASAPFRDNTKPPQVRLVYKIAPDPVRAMPIAFTDTCTTNCIPIIALVARDLDGDHEMDLVAIDANLKIYTALGAQKFGLPQQVPTTLTAIPQLQISVTGR